MSDTPETDAFQSSGKAHYMALHFARKLERERDEARRERDSWEKVAISTQKNLDACCLAKWRTRNE